MLTNSSQNDDEIIVEAVQGYIASDRTFFESEPACIEYEAMLALYAAYEEKFTGIGLSFKAFTDKLHELRDEVRRYLNAHKVMTDIRNRVTPDEEQ